jgi:hypothetical protein
VGSVRGEREEAVMRFPFLLPCRFDLADEAVFAERVLDSFFFITAPDGFGCGARLIKGCEPGLCLSGKFCISVFGAI